MFTNHRAYREYILTQQELSARNYEMYEWMVEHYDQTPSEERPEWLDHYFDREYWEKMNRLTWKDYLREYCGYVVGAIVIVLLLRCII